MTERRHRDVVESGAALPLFASIEASAPRGAAEAASTRRARVRPRTLPDGNDQAQLLTVVEVCERLQCGRTYVYALLQKGILRAVKLGRLTRIPLAELEEFIAHKVVDAPYDVCERWSRGGDRAAM